MTRARWRGRWLAIALIACSWGFVACGSGQAELPGTRLDQPAADFRLTDHRGAPITMAGLRGRPVVLTFLYTTCPDFCPLTAEKLRQTFEALGTDAAKVAVVAISVDPANDTRAAAAAFSERHRLTMVNWHYLVGSAEELAPVWANYAVGVLPPGNWPGTTGPAVTKVGHTEALFLIDSQGKRRTLLRGDFDPVELARAVRTLSK